MMLDGVPRTLTQAQLLKQNNIDVDIVFNFIADDSVIIDKLMGRRICPSCNKNYNVCNIDRDGYFMPAILPKKLPSYCDTCNIHLVVRDDDKESIILERLQTYKVKTEPILQYYREITTVIDFEAKRGVDDFDKMRDILISHTKHF